MDPDWAAHQLEVIRTLMERAAIYRRALAPTALALGGLGIAASAAGYALQIQGPRAFGLYWMAVALLGLAGAFVLMRRQALRDAEPFWSPPARRVVLAVLPPLFVGLVAGVVAVYPSWRDELHMWWLPGVWTVLYGCALHSASFFMPRGLRRFGLIFIGLGCALLVLVNHRSYAAGMPNLVHAHWVMGASFGVLHLIYGIYLVLTRREAAP
jgi:hypothetical protein